VELQGLNVGMEEYLIKKILQMCLDIEVRIQNGLNERVSLFKLGAKVQEELMRIAFLHRSSPAAVAPWRSQNRPSRAGGIDEVLRGAIDA
jgi:hypothetical protein